MSVIFAALVATGRSEETANSAEVWPGADWQVATPESQGLSADGVAQVGEWHQKNFSKTGLVIRHGRIVGEWYAEGTKPSTRLAAFSTTKSFSSTAVGIAIADGKLSLDSTVGQFLPDVQPVEKKPITVRQILSMTTGVHNHGPLNSMPNPFTYAMVEAPLDAPPGEKWNYNNTGLSLLSPLFKQATGQPIDRFLDARVFRPIGIGSADWSWQQREDLPIPYSGLEITARALARFGLMVLRGGRWQNERLVPADWLAAATGPSQPLEKSYGYLWWNNTAGKWPGVPADAFASLGKFDNDMLVVPSLDLIVIRQVGDEGADEHHVNIGDLFRLAVEAVADRSAEK